MLETDINKIIYKYPTNKLIFWLGAGIDKEEPTALPLGNELTVEILKRSCGDIICNKILEQWKISSNTFFKITDETIKLNEYPRLETILEAIRIFETELHSENTVINGLRSFDEAPPNSNHYILAKLLHQGANIVTTNYDNCIPKAYNHLYQSNNEKLKLNDTENIWIYKSNIKDVGSIYHLHGVAKSIEDIGATLSIVKNPIAKYFDMKMDEWLNNGYCFIFLGYGGNDSLDITPYLMSKSSKNAVGIYVQHSKDKKNIVHNNINEKKLLNSFYKRYVLAYNTKEFLNDFIGKEIKLSDFKTNDWKKKFSEYSIEYTKELQQLCALSVIYSLNLNPCKVLGENWINIYSNIHNLNISNWYIGNYGFRNCQRIGQNNEALYFSSLLSKNKLLKSDVRTMRSYTTSILYEWCFIDKVLSKAKKMLENREIVSWNVSTPINRAVQLILCVISLSPININLTKKILKNKGMKLIVVLKKLISAGPLYMQEINQLNVAYINLGILEILFSKNHKKAWEYIKKARYNYAEISSMSGVINTILYEIIYFELLYWYYKDEKIKHHIKTRYYQFLKIIKKEQYINKYKKTVKIITKLGQKIGIKF